jgi:HSP20 family protein
MTRTIRWTPIHPAVWWNRDPFDELEGYLDSPYERQTTSWEPSGWNLPLDVLEKEDAYMVRASTPGIDPADLDITFNDNTLTIRGESSHEGEQREERYVLRERHFGGFTRTIRFPVAVDGENIAAESTNGELRLTLPKAEEVRPHRIEIARGDGRRVVEAETGPECIDDDRPETRQSAPIYPTGDDMRTYEATTEGSEIGRETGPSRGWVEGQAREPSTPLTESEGWVEGLGKRAR